MCGQHAYGTPCMCTDSFSSCVPPVLQCWWMWWTCDIGMGMRSGSGRARHDTETDVPTHETSQPQHSSLNTQRTCTHTCTHHNSLGCAAELLHFFQTCVRAGNTNSNITLSHTHAARLIVSTRDRGVMCMSCRTYRLLMCLFACLNARMG